MTLNNSVDRYRHLFAQPHLGPASGRNLLSIITANCRLRFRTDGPRKKGKGTSCRSISPRVRLLFICIDNYLYTVLKKTVRCATKRGPLRPIFLITVPSSDKTNAAHFFEFLQLKTLAGSKDVTSLYKLYAFKRQLHLLQSVVQLITLTL